MNKLSQGIFEIDGYDFSKDTKLEEMVKLEKYRPIGRNDVKRFVSRPNMVEFFGYNFVAEFVFYYGRLSTIELYPRLDEEYDKKHIELFHEKCFDYCKKLLDEQFDDTIKRIEDKDGIEFYFKGGTAGIPHSYYRKDYEPGGYIYVSFKNQI